MKKTSKPKQTVYEIVTQRMIDYIEQYQELPWMKPWATVESPQKNFVSMRPYNGINALLTGMSGFSSPFWMTFKQVKAKGGTVKKGEKATPVLYWSTFDKKADDEEDEEKLKKLGFHRMYFIFNADQIEGIEFPEFELPKYDFNPIDEAERIIENMPNRPAISRKGTAAYYTPMLDTVTVPKPELFTLPEEFYSTLFHELAHSTGHPSRLNRFKEEGDNHQFGGQSYSKEELVAEMSSAFILNTLGINTKKTDYNSAGYLKAWLKKLKDDPRMVVTAASKAGKAANYIMGKEA
jgi:antirestriction protein ArdC